MKYFFDYTEKELSYYEQYLCEGGTPGIDAFEKYMNSYNEQGEVVADVLFYDSYKKDKFFLNNKNKNQMSKQKITLHLEGDPGEIVNQCIAFATQYGGGIASVYGGNPPGPDLKTVPPTEKAPRKTRSTAPTAPAAPTQDASAYNDNQGDEVDLNKLLIASEYITDLGRDQQQAMNQLLDYFEVGGLSELDPSKYKEVFDAMMSIPGVSD